MKDNPKNGGMTRTMCVKAIKDGLSPN